MKDQIFKMAMHTDLGDYKREDVNDLISSLVRLGYEVWMNDEYICFKIGYDDEIKEIEDEISNIK